LQINAGVDSYNIGVLEKAEERNKERGQEFDNLYRRRGQEKGKVEERFG
jgi:hypothetical protein